MAFLLSMVEQLLFRHGFRACENRYTAFRCSVADRDYRTVDGAGACNIEGLETKRFNGQAGAIYRSGSVNSRIAKIADADFINCAARSCYRVGIGA